jgi:photosystem II cytochrome b559 subunit alpha
MSNGSTGERPFTAVITSVRYWLVHVLTIPVVFGAGVVGVYRGAYYDIFGTPRPNEYFAEGRLVEPLLGDRRRLLYDLGELTKFEKPEILGV